MQTWCEIFSELQNKEKVIVNGKNLIEINDVIVITKKGLYEIVIPINPVRKNPYANLDILEYKMINLITPQYYWPNISKDIENNLKHCHACQINKK